MKTVPTAAGLPALIGSAARVRIFRPLRDYGDHFRQATPPQATFTSRGSDAVVAASVQSNVQLRSAIPCSV
ncbi:hypothetical protein [Albidovulum sediminis]|uniref:Uncharacterized protein n=1 Tax=Albidovulum sediminis TaxID=3066345 RepID=A0ABT2NL05_9RHOB|nr:hypothetical protein [Defluviimonas sediminis]MCT8329603.1 hypothetical protein [Defluviimonas sediminis]